MELFPLQYESGRRCPKTNLWIPSSPEEVNVARLDLLEKASIDENLQKQMYTLCGQSIEWWAAYCCWTYRVRDIDENGREVPAKQPHVPFSLWPVQVNALEEMSRAVQEGNDVVLSKSRDCGMSWLVALLGAWHFMFVPDSQWIYVSRVEESLDRRGDPSSLFWKIEYLLKKQPPWLLPCDLSELEFGGRNRSHLQFRNPETGSTILGQASTGHVGRGGRAQAVVFDEFAAMGPAEDAWRSAADTSGCRIVVSTPLGAGTTYSRLRQQGMTSGTPKIVDVLYYNVPKKGEGRKREIDHDGSVTGMVGRHYWWTPWLQRQIERRADPTDVAQNIFADDQQSGDQFFPSAVVSAHMRQYGEKPERCEIENGRMVPSPDGRWYVWWRPDGIRVSNYVLFADPSYGSGKANSTCAVMDVDDGKIVAIFADPRTAPQDLAEQMAMAGSRIYNGAMPEALVGWETNGAGGAMHLDFERLGYSSLYRQRSVGTSTEKRGKKFGWTSTRSNKRILLGGLTRSLVTEDIIIPCKDSLDEALNYVITEQGGIESASVQDELSGAKEAHGDRIIAIAGCVMLRKEWPIYYEEGSREWGPDTLGAILKVDEDLYAW